jgi:hypothetical protein
MDQATLEIAAEWIGVNDPETGELDDSAYQARLNQVAAEILAAETDELNRIKSLERGE